MVLVAKCPQGQVEFTWPYVSEFIEKPLRFVNGRYELSDVLDLLRSGEAQLFVVADGPEILAACVTQLNKYPRKLMLNVLFVGGTESRNWLPGLIDLLKQYAVSQSADGIEMYGRHGWSKVLTGFGFERGEAVCMELLF